MVLSQLNNLHAICNSDPKSTNNKSSLTAIHHSTLIIILTPVVQDQREITPFTDLKCCLHETNVWIVWVYIVHFPFSLFFVCNGDIHNLTVYLYRQEKWYLSNLCLIFVKFSKNGNINKTDYLTRFYVHRSLCWVLVIFFFW